MPGEEAYAGAFHMKDKLKLVFQPGEEGYVGAYHMLQHSALDDISAIFCLYVIPSLPIGTVASRAGPMLC